MLDRYWQIVHNTLCLDMRQLCFGFYYFLYEITGDPCNLIGSQQCDLFPYRNLAIYIHRHVE